MSPRLRAQRGAMLAAALLLTLGAACDVMQPSPAPPDPAPPPPTATAPAATATPVPLPTPARILSTPSVAPQSQIPNPKSQITDTLARLGATACPNSAFTCVTLDMPLDHDAPLTQHSATMPVVFGVLPASGLRKGTLVVAVGGPGSSGLALADAYVNAWDARIRQRFDIVFFDQRGTGLSRGIQCPQAAAAYFAADMRADTPAQRAALVEAARAFANDCAAQTGAEDALPFLSTRQAVEDLERFRQIIGADRLWLYGESYGTQFAQTYATRHPAQTAGLVLDGAVDLTLSALDYAAESALAFEDALTQTLAACAADALCADDMAGDPAAAYDRLLASVARGPVVFQFPLSTGEMTARALSRPDIDTAVSGYLSAPEARLLTLRAIAAGAQGDFVPLARLFYAALGLDPDTLAVKSSPAWSDAAYYAVTCLDDADGEDESPAARAAAWLDAGRDILTRAPRLGALFYSDLPCAFWPAAGRGGPRPAPFTAPGIPTLVLAATADPLTPFANGARVFSRLEDGYLIATRGGAHVMFGRGNRCVDNAVARFLVEGIPPAQRETTCDDRWVEDYVPIAPADVTRLAGPLEAMRALNDEIEHLPEYYYWDGAGRVAVGCARGGWVSFEMRGARVVFALEACSFSRGLTFSGAGEYDVNADRFSLEGRVDGAAQGRLAYTREAGGRARVTGTYAGQPVDTAR